MGEMSTTRERREARATRLEEWAAKRAGQSDGMHEAARAHTAGIPFGQPILIGHHSEKRHRNAIAKGWDAMGRAVENDQKAQGMADRAASIRKQAAGAIYTDDENAAEALAAKIASMERTRDAMKAANAGFNKANRAELKAMSAWDRDNARPYRSYQITNLTGNISRTKQRLAGLGAAQARQQTDRMITARRSGSCADCGAAIEQGDTIRYSRANGARCATCEEQA